MTLNELDLLYNESFLSLKLNISHVSAASGLRPRTTRCGGIMQTSAFLNELYVFKFSSVFA